MVECGQSATIRRWLARNVRDKRHDAMIGRLSRQNPRERDRSARRDKITRRRAADVYVEV